jgi:CHASE3 domain sensor protein
MPVPSERAIPIPRKRVAKGPKRPDYLQNPEFDKFMMMFTALLAEISALRDRLDTCEALAKAGLPATTEAIEAYALSKQERAVRETRRAAMLDRVFRILMEDREAARDALDRTMLEAVLRDDLGGEM